MPTALITGASSGIGEAFARALAARGDDVVLVARSAGRLETLAAELTASHGVRAHVLPADLADPGAVDALVASLAARELMVETLINNAGFGTHGEFASLDGARERDEVLVNVLAPVMLTHALLPAMIARKSGAIVNVGSTASFQPVPYMAVYGATKAFVLSFSEALAEEVRAHGVRVVALCPGQTDTAFFEGIDDARIGRARTTKQVVDTALRALKRGRVVAIDGFANYALANSNRLAPRRLVARIAAMIERPKRT
ncbi:MAG TPA: SDR family oxidoreductase [Xanthomonadales bacterium]|nr:SDR family oxidoreductase [Xanthomonadales bacterium]